MTSDFAFVTVCAQEVGASRVEVPDGLLDAVLAANPNTAVKIVAQTDKTPKEHREHLCYFHANGKFLMGQNV